MFCLRIGNSWEPITMLTAFRIIQAMFNFDEQQILSILAETSIGQEIVLTPAGFLCFTNLAR